MRRILNIPTLMLLLVATLFMTSCEEDGGTTGGGGGTTDTPSALSLISESDLTLAPAEEFIISIAADKGTNDMNGVYVYENGTKMAESRIKFNGVAASANPALLVGTERESLDWTVSVIAQETAGTVSNYEVEIRDDQMLTSSVTVTVTTASAPPTLTTVGNTTPTFIEGTQNVSMKINAEKGGADLSKLEIRQDEVLVDIADFNWNGLSMMTSGNPFDLTEDEKDGFEEGEFLVDLPNSIGTYVYTIIIEDALSQRDTATFVVTTETSGTPVDIREDEVLNQNGMAAGGLDLDTGDNVPSNSVLAELIDNGIDTDMTPDKNWIQTISAVNGATMKYVVPNANGVPEGYTFASTSTKEEIEGLFLNNTGGEINSTNSTSIVEVGDEFVVSANGNYWLLTVKQVVVTENDNTDKYVFDVKY